VKVAAFSSAELIARLASSGIYLRTGPFISHIQSTIPSVAEGISLLYCDYALEESTDFADFHISISRPANLRHWFRPQAVFFLDGRRSFEPLPVSQAFALLEWGLNWCISNHAHHRLIFHAAVAEKNGSAVFMPGEPGVGKSTLCAALVNRGWRLLSDELALISLKEISITPIARPVSLKNESIDALRRFAPEAFIGPPCHDTTKGTVAHMRAPVDSVERSLEPAAPRWIIFPKYVSGTRTRLIPESKGRAFMRIAEKSFNYSVLGKSAFKTVADLIERCDCYDFTYGDLDEAIAVFDALDPLARSVVGRVTA
jgi:HprK-related kinase A